jgi:hypothetical protein
VTSLLTLSLFLDLSRPVSDAEAVIPSKKIVNIAFVGKYTGLQDSYLSVIKSLKHSSIHLKVKINLQWIEASDLEPVAPLAPLSEGGEDPAEARAGDEKSKYEELLRKHETAWTLLKSAGQAPSSFVTLSTSPSDSFPPPLLLRLIRRYSCPWWLWQQRR